PRITYSLATELLRSEGEDVLARCADSGFLANFGGGVYELHPLLRQFLMTKVDLFDPSVREWFDQLAEFALRHRNWDDASWLLELGASDRLIDRFLDSALGELLLEGRVETLRHWLARAPHRRYRLTRIDLAQEGLLLRPGRPR